MDEKKVNGLQNEIDTSMMFLQAAEEVKKENAEREQRNMEKAAAAAERRRREKALDEAYAEYCGNNPPTREDYEEAKKIIRSCLKPKEGQNDKK